MIQIDSYFSGGGLLDIGIMQSGLDIRRSYEIDSICCKVQEHNLKHEVIEQDISKKLVLEDGAADTMLFTYPCKKYSTIANIHGTRTGEELFLHALRHIALAEPEVYVIENVPGMRAFPIVMEAMTKLPGYYIQVFCPVDSNIWLPQHRKRLIIFGSRKPFNWRPPQKGEMIPLKDLLESDPIVTLPKAIKARMMGKYRDKPIISDPDKGDIAPTCVAHYAKDKSTRLVVDKRFPMGVRPYSVREYARLQGIPDWYEFNCSTTKAYEIIGNGVAVPVGRWIGEEISRYFKRLTI